MPFAKFVVAALAGLMLAAPADAAGVFSAFAGSYRGTGRISDVNGKSESLTCRSTNTPAQDGIAMNLGLTCASDSYRVDFHADLFTDGQSLHGTWTETTRAVNGNVSGSITPSVINATTSAPGFAANIVIQVQKNGRLDIALSATGTSINHVQVSMRK